MDSLPLFRRAFEKTPPTAAKHSLFRVLCGTSRPYVSGVRPIFENHNKRRPFRPLFHRYMGSGSPGNNGGENARTKTSPENIPNRRERRDGLRVECACFPPSPANRRKTFARHTCPLVVRRPVTRHP